MTERKWLSVCAAFASGEALASLVPNFAEAWPVAVFAAVFAAVWGISLSFPIWRLFCVFALGIAVFLRSGVESERCFRERPWMREVFAGRRGGFRRQPPVVSAIRRDLSRRMGIGLGHSPETADMNRAILLGERRYLRPETRRVFVESGTVHVFAISGLHVMVIANVFIVLTAFLAFPFRFRALAAAPPLWAYVWIVGAPPSAVRAALMASIHFAAPVFWRKPNGVVSWSMAFMIMHLLEPQMVSDAGCQLSFAVMLALVVASRHVKRWPALWGRLAVAFAAWAAGVPIVAYRFGALTPGGLLANLALVPAAGAAVVACVSALAASWVCESLAAHLNNLAALVTAAMAGISSLVARLPGSNFEIRNWGIAECVAWYALLSALPRLSAWFSRRKPF